MKPTVALVLVSALLAACGSSPKLSTTDRPATLPTGSANAPALALPDLSAYRLGIGDKVRIDVFGEPDLSIEGFIDGSGRLSYPLLGSVDASRKTAAELQAAIHAGLAAGYLKEPDVRVTVVQYRPFYAVGQVKRAGSYPYVIGLTVEKAIAIAGGLTNLASTRKIYLLNESAPTRRKRVGLDAIVLPGDTLLVEEGLF